MSREIAGVLCLLCGTLRVYSLFALFDGVFAVTMQSLFTLLALLGTGIGGYYVQALPDSSTAVLGSLAYRRGVCWHRAEFWGSRCCWR